MTDSYTQKCFSLEFNRSPPFFFLDSKSQNNKEYLFLRHCHLRLFISRRDRVSKNYLIVQNIHNQDPHTQKITFSLCIQAEIYIPLYFSEPSYKKIYLAITVSCYIHFKYFIIHFKRISILLILYLLIYLYNFQIQKI